MDDNYICMMYEPTICFFLQKLKIIIIVVKMAIFSLSCKVGGDNTRSTYVRNKILGYIKWKIFFSGVNFYWN